MLWWHHDDRISALTLACVDFATAIEGACRAAVVGIQTPQMCAVLKEEPPMLQESGCPDNEQHMGPRLVALLLVRKAPLVRARGPSGSIANEAGGRGG